MIIILYINYNVILSLVGTSYMSNYIICTVMSLSRCGLTNSKNLFWIGAPPVWILILNVCTMYYIILCDDDMIYSKQCLLGAKNSLCVQYLACSITEEIVILHFYSR